MMLGSLTVLGLALTMKVPDQTAPEKSITDLVGEAAPWGHKWLPNYSTEVTPSTTSIPAFPRWLPGKGKTQLEFRFHLDKPTTFVAQIARCYAPSNPTLALDGKLVSSLPVSTSNFTGAITDSPEGPLGNVDVEFWTPIPAGNHTVVISNSGSAPIEVPTVRIAGLGPKAFHMERKEVRTVEVREVIRMTAPKISMKWWGVGVGSFPDDDGQTLRSLKISAIDAGHQVQKVRDRTGQPFNFLKAEGRPKHTNSIAIEVVAVVTLYQRTLVPGAPEKAPVLSSADRTRYTQFVDNSDVAPLSQWMTKYGLEWKRGESDLSFAQRLLNVIQKSLRYKWDSSATKGIRACLGRGWGACGELNELAAASLKLAGIPARIRQGRNVVGATRAFSAEDDGTMHVAAEFWANGVGWVPIEASAFSGSSLNVGGPLQPYLGRATAEHLNKHYDFAYLDAQKRSFQTMDFPFGEWDGTWDGWKTEGLYGFRTLSYAPSDQK